MLIAVAGIKTFAAARAGLPPAVLAEINVEPEVSCRLEVPLWTLAG